jgi:hypothetical protein
MSEPVSSEKKSWPRILSRAALALGALVAYAANPGLIETYVQHALDLETNQESLISNAATRVYGGTVLVHCTDKTGFIFSRDPGSLGSTPVLGLSRVILLKPRACDNLEMFADGLKEQQNVSSAEVFALHELAHELSHMTGDGTGWVESDERIVECYAAQRLPEVARAFGASPGLANTLGQAGAEEWETGLENYDRPLPGCVDGGQYDLDPANPGFFPQPKKQTK